MKKIMSLALAGVTISLLACQPNKSNDPDLKTSVTPPTGSYILTCNSSSVVNDALSASCQTLKGNFKQTTLKNLNSCIAATRNGGDISNIDGNLICVPDLPKVTGLEFPQSEITINQWVYGDKTDIITQHGWSIWAGLTTITGQVNGVDVRAFETWPTTTNMVFRVTSGQAPPQRRLHLETPRRFKNKPKHMTATAASDGDTGILVSVAYNPPAANHAITNKLFLQSTLDNFIKEGYDEIPNFPNNAITIKPVYKHIPKNVPNGIYKFPGWPGTPSPAKAFPESDWNACVYVNINLPSSSANSIDNGCANQNADNTFALSDFIYHQVTAADANYLSSQVGSTISEGDYVILVGMHVTTRETKRWTWQTFFWSANKNNPYLPSSQAIATQRPDNLIDPAAQHYAMSIAYQMVEPAQPITGGSNSDVSSLVAYNPHLEAEFDPKIFNFNNPSPPQTPNPLGNEYGVQTNCMGCHVLASYNPTWDYNANKEANRENPYASDMYISLDDKVFNKTLKLDFAWSILGSMKDDR